MAIHALHIKLFGFKRDVSLWYANKLKKCGENLMVSGSIAHPLIQLCWLGVGIVFIYAIRSLCAAELQQLISS